MSSKKSPKKQVRTEGNVAVAELKQAPGAPGIVPHWTNSQKDGVGTARSREPRLVRH